MLLTEAACDKKAQQRPPFQTVPTPSRPAMSDDDGNNNSNSSNKNPLTTDAKLQRLLAQADALDSETAYISWRESFLKQYRRHLDPDGVLNAQDANYRLLKKLLALEQSTSKVHTLTINGNLDIGRGHVTALGRRGLTNLSDQLQDTTTSLERELMPATQADEDRLGFDKFELASTLIEDGFHGHALLIQTRVQLTSKTTQMVEAGMVDESFATIVRRYSATIDSLIQVLQDLGLYKIVRQCVDVVYADTKRPEPKAPPAVDENDVDDEDVVVRSKGGGRDPTTESSRGSTSERESKKTKKKEKKGIQDSMGSNGDNKSTGSMSRGAKDPNDRRANGSMDPRVRAFPQNEGGEEDTEKKEAEKEEPPPPQEGQEAQPEHLIIFDPKTNLITMVNRAECGAKSQLLVDINKEGDDAYQGMITDDREKQEIIWLLKKLEKTKPKEESWLEAIKREKAEETAKGAKKIAGTVKVSKTNKKLSTSSHHRKMVSSSHHSESLTVTTQSSGGGGSGGGGGGGFRNPMAGSSSHSSSAGAKKRTTVEDYQGMYKKGAPKPDAGGWRKLS